MLFPTSVLYEAVDMQSEMSDHYGRAVWVVCDGCDRCEWLISGLGGVYRSWQSTFQTGAFELTKKQIVSDVEYLEQIWKYRMRHVARPEMEG